MEQRLRKLVATFLISTLMLSTTSAIAASPSAKPTPNPSASSTDKETKKPVVKKKVVKKKKKAKKKKLPALQPVACFGKTWPPAGSTQNGEIFAKIPTQAELECESSDLYNPIKSDLRKDLPQCVEYACGNVTVTSEAGCTWWEVTSTFERIDLKTGKIEATLGTLRTLSKGTKPKVIQSIMLISGVKHKDADGNILKNIKASGIAVSCHHDAVPDLTNRNFFTAN